MVPQASERTGRLVVTDRSHGQPSIRSAARQSGADGTGQPDPTLDDHARPLGRLLRGAFALPARRRRRVARRRRLPLVHAPIDPDATPQTRALLRNLAALEGRHVLFGHQDDLAYGTHWSADDGSPDGRSDVRDVTGAYPSVQGFDVGQMETGADRNVDGLPFVDIRRWVRQAHAGGSVVTVSWHASHLPTGGPTWTRVETIPDLLPGGSHAQAFTAALDRLADFLADLTDDAGRPIPVVFRPYHEHNGEWFWWGRGSTGRPTSSPCGGRRSSTCGTSAACTPCSTPPLPTAAGSSSGASTTTTCM